MGNSNEGLGHEPGRGGRGAPAIVSPPRFGLRYTAVLALASVVVALGMNWEVVANAGHDFPQRLNDPMLESWEVAWDAHALVHQPTALFQANTFWPLRDTLAFSDTLLGYSPAGLIGRGPYAALVRYNVLFLLAYALAFAGGYLLARELGLGWGAASVAAAAFAYAPWRLSQNGHLSVLSSGGIPLALFLLMRGWRRRRPGLVLAGWLVAAWQVSLGFGIGVGFAYLMAAIALLALIAWLRAGRPALGRNVVAATIVGVTTFIVVGLTLARPYYRVEHEYSAEAHQRESVAILQRFSPPPSGYLVAPADNVLLGSATRASRDRLDNPDEQSLYPGALTVLLAGIAVPWGRFPARWRFGLLGTVLVLGVLAMGVNFGGTRSLYLFVWRHLPGWRSTRTPGRLTTFVSLGLALMAGVGAEVLIRALEPFGRKLVRLAPSGAVSVLLVGAVLTQGAGHLPHTTAPVRPAALDLAPNPRFELPADPPVMNATYVYWSVDGFPSLANGYSGLDPASFVRLRRISLEFPSPRSIEYLRANGIRSVVLHLDLARGTPWQDTGARDTTGLGISVRRLGNLIVYDLGT